MNRLGKIVAVSSVLLVTTSCGSQGIPGAVKNDAGASDSRSVEVGAETSNDSLDAAIATETGSGDVLAETGSPDALAETESADALAESADTGSPDPHPWGPILGTATEIAQTSYAFVSLEGPYWVANGSYLLFSDVVERNSPGAKIYKYDPAANAFSVFPYPTSAPASTNGLGIDSKGQLIAAERYNHQVTRIETGLLKVLASTYPATGGKAFNAPNDLVIDGRDNIYFTDTRYGSMYSDAMLVPSAAYRIAVDGTLTQLYLGGPDPLMNSINGIALSRDGMTLYLGDDTANKLWKLPLTADGLIAAGTTPTLLVDQSTIPGDRFRVPDGINIDDDGNLYVALNHHDSNAIAVFDADGTYQGRYDVPVGLDRDPDGGAPLDPGGRGPSNITFGGADRKTMYITTLHAIYRVQVPIAGKP